MKPDAVAAVQWRPFAGVMTVVVAASLVLSCRPTRLVHEQASGGRGPTTHSPARASTSPEVSVLSTPLDAVRVVLGRAVAFDGPRVLRTLTDAPDEEVADIKRDVAVFLSEDSHIRAFALSTGTLLWERTTFAPCRHLLLAGSSVFSGCGNKVLSFETTTGHEHVVDGGPNAGDPILVSRDATVAVPDTSRGRVTLYEVATGRLLSTKVLPELSHAFQHDVLANPASAGICALGLVAGPHNTSKYRAACYGEDLVRQWGKAFTFPADRAVTVRQLGPEHLVLDDQESAPDSSSQRGRGVGRGLAVHWRDGQSRPLADKTFATLEDAAGNPLALDSDVFSLARALAPADLARFPIRSAKIVADADHVFAVITNGTTGLAGVDRSTGHVLFLVPVRLGVVWRLDVGPGGMPIVRSRFADRWEVTIHDALTGSIRYRDSRPRQRGAPN
jgi:hypothetical protein